MQNSMQNYLRRTGIKVYLTENCALMFLLFRLLFQDLKPHMVGAFEDFGRQTASPGSGEFVNI